MVLRLMFPYKNCCYIIYIETWWCSLFPIFEFNLISLSKLNQILLTLSFLISVYFWTIQQRKWWGWDRLYFHEKKNYYNETPHTWNMWHQWLGLPSDQHMKYFFNNFPLSLKTKSNLVILLLRLRKLDTLFVLPVLNR